MANHKPQPCCWTNIAILTATVLLLLTIACGEMHPTGWDCKDLLGQTIYCTQDNGGN